MATARGAKVDAPTSASRPDPLGSIDAEGDSRRCVTGTGRDGPTEFFTGFTDNKLTLTYWNKRIFANN